MIRRLVAITLFSLLWAQPALAQDDDLLAPVPVKKKPPPAKPPVRPVRRPADDLLAPVPNRPKLPAEPSVTRPKAPAVEPGILTVRLAAATADAEVTIDGKDITTTAGKGVPVEPGEHQLIVRRLGFGTLSKRISVPAGKPFEINAVLPPVAAVITLSTDATQAQVFLNGRSVGYAPIAGLEVPPGQLEISVRKEGYRDDSRTLSVVAGRDYPVTVRLLPGAPPVSDRPVETSLTPTASLTDSPVVDPVVDQPITTKPAFWIVVTGVVVAAAAATVTAVLLNTSATKARSDLAKPTSDAAGASLCQVLTGGTTCEVLSIVAQ